MQRTVFLSLCPSDEVVANAGHRMRSIFLDSHRLKGIRRIIDAQQFLFTLSIASSACSKAIDFHDPRRSSKGTEKLTPRYQKLDARAARSFDRWSIFEQRDSSPPDRLNPKYTNDREGAIDR